jgi:hypothetical protein
MEFEIYLVNGLNRMVNVTSFVYVSIVLQPRKPLGGLGGEKRGKETERG